jgi:SAM-dependent MidA family methyltransferase
MGLVAKSAPHFKPLSKLSQIIANEIEIAGKISFARFSELALYCPVYGFYEKEGDNIGRDGDYYTSVSVGPLFGELLGFQMAQWLRHCDLGQAPLRIVEAGAHDGKLARDILNWFRQFAADLYERIEYWIVEPSAARQQWQQRTLLEFEGRIFWAKELATLGVLPSEGRVRLSSARRKWSSVSDCSNSAESSIRGVIFCNELLDAFPRHRLGWDAKKRKWFEWGVGMEDGRFAWMRLDGDASGVSLAPALPTYLLSVLPDGFTTEVCPLAEEWWRQAAGMLASGKLAAIDYGLLAEEFFAPNRSQGTLRSYRKHQLRGDVLAQPGEQDITGHVNFTAIQNTGEGAGLNTEVFVSQEQFLTGIVANVLKRPESFEPWNSKHSRQLQTLIHPEHLGRAFHVLVQSRTATSHDQ